MYPFISIIYCSHWQIYPYVYIWRIYAYIWRKRHTSHTQERERGLSGVTLHGDLCFSQSHSLSGKILSARYGIPPLSLVREFPKTPQKNTAFAIALDYLTKLDKTLLLKVQHTLFIGHEGINLGASTLLVIFHSTGKCQAGCWGQGSQQQSHLGVNHVSCNNDWPDKTWPCVQWWRKCYECHQLVSGLV